MRLFCSGCQMILESLKKEAFEETFYCRQCGVTVVADYDKDNEEGEDE